MSLGSRIVSDLRARGVKLPGFHAGFVRAAYASGVELAALSVPRGSAKTWLAGQLAAQALRPGSPTFEAGIEVLGVAGSLEQARVMLGFTREALAAEAGAYRWLDSGQRIQVTHKASGTKFRILSSSGKRAMGLVNFSTIFADEPAAWEARGGALMFDALRTSIGKRPGQRLILIGTRAPAAEGSWWPDLLDGGNSRGVHVEVRSAPSKAAWDAWNTIRAVNPLAMLSASLRKTILRERDAARKNPSLRAAFEAYRLNRQVEVTKESLVPVATWDRVEAREAPPRVGRPILGFDLGQSRSWSAAWAIWSNGRCECYALAPGVPSLEERERQDAMPRGLYRKLADEGTLIVDEGLRVSRPSRLVEHLREIGIEPEVVFADRFLFESLQDSVAARYPVILRRTRWSEATEDIASFRRIAEDGPLSIAPECRRMAAFAMSQATVLSDDQGSVRLVKRDKVRARDDVAIASVLACGAFVRSQPSEAAADQVILESVLPGGQVLLTYADGSQKLAA